MFLTSEGVFTSSGVSTSLNFFINPTVLIQVIANSWTSEEFELSKGERIGSYFGRFMDIKIRGPFSQFKGNCFNNIHECSYNKPYYQFKITSVKHVGSNEETAVIAIRDITLNKQLSEEYGEIKK